MSASTSALRVRAVLSSRRVRLTIRVLVCVGVLVAVVAQVGSEPFVHGVFSIDPRVIGRHVRPLRRRHGRGGLALEHHRGATRGGPRVP